MIYGIEVDKESNALFKKEVTIDVPSIVALNFNWGDMTSSPGDLHNLMIWHGVINLIYLQESTESIEYGQAFLLVD